MILDTCALLWIAGGTPEDRISGRTLDLIDTVPEDHILSVVFDNGENGRLDIKPMLEFGVFKKIKDPNAFQRVRVSFDTIEWDCGVDLDPEFVYRTCEIIPRDKQGALD